MALLQALGCLSLALMEHTLIQIKEVCKKRESVYLVHRGSSAGTQDASQPQCVHAQTLSCTVVSHSHPSRNRNRHRHVPILYPYIHMEIEAQRQTLIAAVIMLIISTELNASFRSLSSLSSQINTLIYMKIMDVSISEKMFEIM